MNEQELFETLDPQHHAVVRGWLDRGDGVAIYENHALDSSLHGHKKFVSFGSDRCQLEPQHCDPDGMPPQRLPDIGDSINWPYQLIGTVRR